MDTFTNFKDMFFKLVFRISYSAAVGVGWCVAIWSKRVV